MKKGPYTVVSSKDIYKNQWIHVKEDAVIRPDGTQGIFGTVEYGRGVSILPLDSDTNVVLVKEYDYVLGEYGLKIPSGGVDETEEPIHGAKRELLEETGYETNHWTSLGYVNPLTMVIKLPQYLFLAEKIEHVTEKSEVEIELVKVPFKTAYEWVMENKITHSPSCVAILKTKLLLKGL